MKYQTFWRRWSAPAVIIALSALTLLAVSACGGDSTTTSAAGGSDAASRSSNDDAAKQDACKLVTQQDASALFGQPASAEEGDLALDANMTGECLWTYDTDTGNQLIQFRIWNGPQYYGELPDSQPFDIGEKGFVRTNEFTGVDIEWIQDGMTYTLSYSTTGTGVPKAPTKVEQVKSLAKKVEDQV